MDNLVHVLRRITNNRANRHQPAAVEEIQLNIAIRNRSKKLQTTRRQEQNARR